MREVVIVSAVRTAGGAFGGSLRKITAPDLGSKVIDESVKKAGISHGNVDQVIFGNAWQAGVGANPARIAAVRGGLPVTVPAFTVNIRCGSSLRALQLGVLSIAAGESEIVVAGGTESSSNVPYTLPDARWGHRMGSKQVDDVLHKDGFICPLADMFMGETAEILVDRYNITRTEQDEFALNSQIKAKKAFEQGAFKEEIVPIQIKDKNKGIVMFDKDETIRVSSLESLAKLPLVFKKDGTITAGNSCALSDAASSVVLMSADKAKEMGLKPMAKILSYSYVALEPTLMGIGPAKAIPEVLIKANMELSDIDLVEINEAFASQVIACNRELNIDMDKLNVNGGAIALGHPVAATGTKILTTLLYSLKNQDKQYGLVSLCIGGGQGVAMIVERIN